MAFNEYMNEPLNSDGSKVYNSNIEDIIYGSFVKMERLQKITYECFGGTSIANATNLNIFIDLYSVLKSVFSESNRTNITDYTSITSCIINMCSHYRSFFKGLSVKTKFYLIFSYNTCDINRKFVANYNDIFYKKSEVPLFRKIAEDNMTLLDTICPYLPDIYFIRSAVNYESSILIANLIENYSDGAPNLIISKDLYPLQLTSIYPNTSYLYPIKTKLYGDQSIMIPINEKSSYKQEFWNLYSRIRKTDIKFVEDLSPINFPILNALNRFPERCLTSIYNIRTASKIIRNLIGSENIKLNPNQLFENDDNSIPVALIESRTKVLDYSYIYNYYKQDPESKVINLQNLEDSAAINTINSRFFSKNPIDLQKL